MIVRVLASVVALLLLIPSLLFGGVLAVDLLVLAATLLGLWEYGHLTGGKRARVVTFVMVVAWAALAASMLYALDAKWVVIALWSSLILMFCATIVRPGQDLAGTFDAVGRTTLGVLWIGGCFLFLPLIRRVPDGLGWLWLVFAISWGSDSGAYLVGRAIGKRKLHVRLSPKKTWAGLVGGLVAAVLFTGLINGFFQLGLKGWEAVLLGSVLGVAGVLGDLAVSLLKRAVGAKDSGIFMPGHGGLLDRVDSVLFVAPLLYIYLFVTRGY
jgi:phosphatidate cytidylyltransferase